MAKHRFLHGVDQVPVKMTSVARIMSKPAFAIGFADARAGDAGATASSCTTAGRSSTS